MLENGKLATLNIKDVLPNRFQPRIHFDEQKLSELAESISKYGLIQPIVVRQIGTKYEIIAGERRYKASYLANKETIPAIIVTLSDRDCEEIALLENIQREDLTPIEEAVSYKRILDVGYISQEELAKKIGKSQIAILNKMRLLNLDDTVQDALLHGKISERHARSLLKIKNSEKQVEMLNRIINERLTVKMTDREINNLLEEEGNEIETLSTSDRPVRRAIPVSSHKIIKVTPPKELLDKIDKKKEERVDTMDIDKILEEAQDITPSEEAKPEANMASLMEQNPNTVTSPLITNDDAIITETEPAIEPGKFVTSGVSNEEVKTTPQVPTSSVSFDAVFNANPSVDATTTENSAAAGGQPATSNGVEINTQSTIPEVAVSGNATLQNTSEAVSTPTVEATPSVANNQVDNNVASNPAMVTENSTEEDINNTASSLASEVTSDVVAENLSDVTWPNEQVNSAGTDNIAPQTLPAPENPAVVNNMSVVPPVSSETPSTVAPENPAVTAEPVTTSPEVVASQPGVSYPSEVPIYIQQPASPEANVMPSTNINAIPNIVLPDEAAIPTPATEPQAVSVQQVSETPNIVLPEVSLDQMPTVEEPAFAGQISIPVQPAAPDVSNQPVIPQEPMLSGLPGAPAQNPTPNVDMNIPDDSILEDPLNVQTPAQVNDNLAESANFRQVMNIVRNSVAEIEKLGFYVDKEELDLGDKYQITFKIDKQ